MGLSTLLAVVSPLAGAATLTVANLNDSGPGSLRQAVITAQSTPDADEIVFAPTLSGAITLTSGPLRIDKHKVTITGPGADVLALDGTGNTVLQVRGSEPGRGAFQFLHERDHPGTDVAISGVTITNGFRGIETGGPYSVDLTVSDCVISGNAETGVHIDQEYAGGRGLQAIQITDTLITGNGLDGVATFGEWSEYCSVRMDNVTATDNGRRGISSRANDLQVGNSLISGNAEGIVLGGDINYYAATLTLSDSVIAGNDGSGIAGSTAYLRLLRSTVAGNGGIGIVSGGSFFAPFISSSTISSNGNGGIQLGTDCDRCDWYKLSTRLFVDNTTISGNLNGPGIMLGDMPTRAQIRHSTIADHPAGAIATLDGISATSGTAYPVDIVGSIVAGSGTGADPVPDLSGPGAVGASYSLIENPGGAPLHDDGTNVFKATPKLAPLADNGGPTPTRALLPGSPAIDRGNPAFAPPPSTDQRGGGYERVANGRIDMGSFERQRAGGSDAAALLQAIDADDGRPWIVVIAKPDDAGPTWVVATDALSGATTGRFGLSTGARPVAAAVMPDFRQSPAPEVAVLGDDARVETRDLQSGAWISSKYFGTPSNAWIGLGVDMVPIDLVTLPSLFSRSDPDLAMLGGGGNRVEIRSSVGGDAPGSGGRSLSYPPELQPKDLVVTDDLSGDGTPDLAVLGEHVNPTGRDTIELWSTTRGTIDLGRSHTVHETVAVGDVDGDGIGELATLRSNAAGVNVVIHNPETASEVGKLFFRKAFRPLRLIAPGDVNGNGSPDLGLIGLHLKTGATRIEVRDTETGDVVSRAWINSSLVFQDAAVVGDINGNGSAEVAVLGRRPTGGRLELTVIIKDAATGQRLRELGFRF